MGTTYYVAAANGNNNNAGIQIDQPLRTIQAAINKAQAGDSILVRDGTYAERLHIQKAATADAPIKLTAYESERPIIDGAALNIPSGGALVVVQQSQDLALAGLTIRNAGGRGLHITRSSRITIQDCIIESCMAGGLHTVQGDTLLIERCHIRDCARNFLSFGPSWTNVALLIGASKNVVVRQNQVFENSAEGIVVSPGSSQVTITGNTCYDNRSGQIGIISSRDIVIDSNLCYHTGRSEFLDLHGHRGPGITKNEMSDYRTGGTWHTRNVEITNNIVVGCGVGFRAGYDSGRLTAVRVAHNTIVNSTEFGFQICTPEKSSGTFIENNLVTSPDNSPMVQASPHASGVVWRYNLWSSYPGEQAHNPSSDVIDSEMGLVDRDAPVTAGTLTADPYKLVSGSVAIDRGLRLNGSSGRDFWGVDRDGRPDLGAFELPNGKPPLADELPLPPKGVRVSANLLSLYDFREGQGQQVRDVGGVGEPLNLTIRDTAKVAWSENGLLLKEATILTSERPASKIIEACRKSHELTVEAWVTPANVTQDGPARIVSISGSKTARNFTLGQGLYGDQAPDLFVARLRTDRTSDNGLPAVISPLGSATPAPTHLVYTRTKEGVATLYINGQERAVLAVNGALSNWDTKMPLLLANEMSEDRPWVGQYRLVALFSRALAAAEVLHNYEAGLPNENAIIPEFTIPNGDEYGVAPHSVEFDASSSTAEAGIASYFWEFGDGQTSNRSSPAYVYTGPGIFTVSLTVTDNQGRTAKVVKERLIKVVTSPIPGLPANYARFILVNVAGSTVLAFGLQYPDLRCALMWNSDPFHMLVFSTVLDVQNAYTTSNEVELIWVDQLENV